MTKNVYGYCVSTREQNEDRQLIELHRLGISDRNIFMDKQSGKDFNRPQYQKDDCQNVEKTTAKM